MKTLFLSPSLSSQAGGIFEIMQALAHNLSSQSIKVEAVGLEDSAWQSSREAWGTIPASAFDCSGPPAFGYSPGLRQAVMGSNAELLHLHSLWMYPSILARQWHRKTARPYVVTPNGMLEPWALANSAWKKRIAAALYEKRMLAGACCLQANTSKECADIRKFGLKNPVAVIPNGVELPCNIPLRTSDDSKKRLLFLGRLHPKKGLPGLLEAWAAVKANARGWQLVIAGWDQGGHGTELKKCCDELGISWMDAVHFESGDLPRKVGTGTDASVIFEGPVFGDRKRLVLEQADAFILPSFSEGLPIAVLEAWANHLPVLMTPECNLPEGFQAGAALEIGAQAGAGGNGTRISAIRQSLEFLMEMSPEDRGAMGAAGRKLVENRFSWPQVARQMAEVYRWVVGGGAKPDTVS